MEAAHCWYEEMKFWTKMSVHEVSTQEPMIVSLGKNYNKSRKSICDIKERGKYPESV